MPYVFGIFCTMAAVQAWLSLKLHRTIRGRYAGLWPELGKPGIFSNTFQGWIAMTRWLRRGAYRDTGDAAFIRLCEAIRISTRLYYLVFVVAVVSILWLIVGRS